MCYMINSNGNKGYFLCNEDGAVKFYIIFNMQMIDIVQNLICLMHSKTLSVTDRESELKGREDIKATSL